MKSIQTKFLVVVIMIILLVAVTITVISAIYITDILNTDSDVITESVANTESQKIDAYLKDIEYTVNSMKNYVMSTLKTKEELADKPFRDAYADSAQDTFFAMVNNFKGIVSFYLRFAPEVSDNTSGFFMSKTTDYAALHEIAPTDLTDYENAPYDTVCWFTEPRRSGQPTWILPYLNPENDIYVISFVVPLYIDTTFIGVAGVDVDFSKITGMVTQVSVYDNGFAYLASEDESTIYFSPVDYHTLDRTHTDHGFAEEYRTIANGMTFVIHADYSDIQRESYQMIALIVLIVALFLTIFILITWMITKRIISPLRKLTAAAEMLADGNAEIKLDDCKTGDEVGILAEAFEKTADKLRGYMSYINALAYKDALTGIKNLTAYSEAKTDLDVKIKLGECSPFAVMVADVNGLKITNDKYGHEVGNKLLIKSAKTLCDVFKHSTAYRIGGDEFVIILKGEDLENSEALLCLLDERLDKTFINAGDAKFKVSVARAIAHFDSDTDSSFDDVFNRADKKMYENKNDIKNDAKSGV